MALVRLILLTACCLAGARAFAFQYAFLAELNGEHQAPPNDSWAEGSAIVTIDTALQTMRIRAAFNDLFGDVTAVNIHGVTTTLGEGVAISATAIPTLPGLPAGVDTGAYDQTFAFNASATFNPNYLSANFGIAVAPTLLLNGMLAGKSYINICSTAFPDGEIRGFLLTDPKADFDHSGEVAQLDLDILRGAFGATASGDANDDGLSDGDDALLWQRQLGTHATLAGGGTGGHSGHGIVAVPEPAGAASVTACLAVLAGVAKRRRVRVGTT